MEEWVRDGGPTEVASATRLDKETGIAAHMSLGYREVERLVHCARRL